MKEDIELRSSLISGNGVFAMRDFAPGEIVLRWDLSHRVHRSQLSALSPEKKHFLVKYDNDYFVINQPPYSCVNHSCDPNTKVFDFCDVATRPIKCGEEITSDYADENVGSLVGFECKCGSPNCKGFLLATG